MTNPNKVCAQCGQTGRNADKIPRHTSKVNYVRMVLHCALLHPTPGLPHKEFLAAQDWEGQHQADVPRAGAAFQLRLRSSVAPGWRVMGPVQAGCRASVFSLIKVTLVTR